MYWQSHPKKESNDHCTQVSLHWQNVLLWSIGCSPGCPRIWTHSGMGSPKGIYYVGILLGMQKNNLKTPHFKGLGSRFQKTTGCWLRRFAHAGQPTIVFPMVAAPLFHSQVGSSRWKPSEQVQHKSYIVDRSPKKIHSQMLSIV